MDSKDLREAVASYLRTARAVRCEADQIIIVSGSQQGLEITARGLLDPGVAYGWKNQGTGLREACSLQMAAKSFPFQ
jgi:GntR family transcriptional regulator/MocR family aminotransferase